jgi:hypothetical protein
VAWFTPSGKKRNRMTAPLIATAAVVAVLLLVSGVYVLLTQGNHHKVAAGQPSPPAPVKWQPITNAALRRVTRWQPRSDGTIWIFGGIGSDGAVIANHEAMTPADGWKSGDDLPFRFSTRWP